MYYPILSSAIHLSHLHFHNLDSTSEFLWYQVSDKYDEDINNDKYTYLLDHFNGDRSGINKYLVKAKEAIAKHVNQELKNEITLPPDELYDNLPSMLKIPLMKYHGVTKFMALIACIGNVSGILPNLKFIHHGTYVYEANLYAWIVAQQASGKDVVNKMQRLFSTIESKMKKEYDFNYAKYKERQEEAKLSGTTFNEKKPLQRTLYLGADITKAGFIQGLVRNNSRAIISTTEAQTLISSNYTTYGAFLDLILACYGHERYEKTLKDNTYNIEETYLSLILAATPENTFKFFANANVDNGLLSRFFHRAKLQGKQAGRPKGSKDTKKRKKSGYILREANKRKMLDEENGIHKSVESYLN